MFLTQVTLDDLLDWHLRFSLAEELPGFAK